MKKQILITFKGSDFIGQDLDNFYDVRDQVGSVNILDLIATAICWQFDFNNDEHETEFEKAVKTIVGYKTLKPKYSKDPEYFDSAILAFVRHQIKRLTHMIPDAVNLDYSNRKVYMDEKSNTVYLVVSYYDNEHGNNLNSI